MQVLNCYAVRSNRFFLHQTLFYYLTSKIFCMKFLCAMKFRKLTIPCGSNKCLICKNIEFVALTKHLKLKNCKIKKTIKSSNVVTYTELKLILIPYSVVALLSLTSGFTLSLTTGYKKQRKLEVESHST